MSWFYYEHGQVLGTLFFHSVSSCRKVWRILAKQCHPLTPVTRRSFLQTLEGGSVNIVSVPLQTPSLLRKCLLIYALLTFCQPLMQGFWANISIPSPAKCCRLSQCQQVCSVGSHVVHITMLNHPMGMHCISWHRHLVTNHCSWPHGIPCCLTRFYTFYNVFDGGGMNLPTQASGPLNTEGSFMSFLTATPKPGSNSALLLGEINHLHSRKTQLECKIYSLVSIGFYLDSFI